MRWPYRNVSRRSPCSFYFFWNITRAWPLLGLPFLLWVLLLWWVTLSRTSLIGFALLYFFTMLTYCLCFLFMFLCDFYLLARLFPSTGGFFFWLRWFGSFAQNGRKERLKSAVPFKPTQPFCGSVMCAKVKRMWIPVPLDCFCTAGEWQQGTKTKSCTCRPLHCFVSDVWENSKSFDL